MAFYTVECIVSVFRKNKDAGGTNFRQVFWMSATHFLCFLTLYIESGDLNYLIFYVFVQLLMIIILTFVRLIYSGRHKVLLNNMCMLSGLGFMIIARLSFEKALKQYVIVIISFVISMFLPYLLNRFQFWKKLTWFYAFSGIFFLAAVLILGEITHGSKLSYTIQGVTFQPSEFVKLIFIFFLAAALWEDQSFKRVVVTTLFAAVYIVILVLSKDLGSALIFFVTYIFVLFTATGSYLYLFLCTCGGVGGSLLAYQFFSHIRIRVQAWQDPWSYIDSQGYQITQSLFAISSGSWFGMGLLRGTPSDIPYVEADFIFSAICEELGVIFAIMMILICLVSFLIIIRTAIAANHLFYKLVALGLGVLYLFQIFLTVGGGIKFIPMTGVTLPLISYGGSSCMSTVLLYFIVQSIVIRNRKPGEKHVEITK